MRPWSLRSSPYSSSALSMGSSCVTSAGLGPLAKSGVVAEALAGLSETVERSHRVGDVLTQARDRPTVRGGERIIASVRGRLAYGRAAHLQRAVLDAPHRPGGVERRRLAQRRSEA